MRSSGFGLGKKQSRGDEPRRQPPTGGDLTQLLASSQKSPDKTFSLSWHIPDKANCLYTLSVTNCGSAQRDRRGWSTSAIDSSAIGEAEWKLFLDTDSLRSEVFSMKSSDSFLVQTMLDELSLAGGVAAPVGGMPASVAAAQSDGAQEYGNNSAYGAQQQQQSASPAVQEGSLRQTKIRVLVESFNQHQTTGRLICDLGTVQSEVFFTQGEPVHAKSCHSISQGRDLIGDAALIDLLTWTDGTFKFQDGWPAASKSVNHPLAMFLAGQVAIPEPATAPAPPPVNRSAAQPQTVFEGTSDSGYSDSGYSDSDYSDSQYSSNSEYAQSTAPAQANIQAQAHKLAAPPPASPQNYAAGSPDDFSQVDDMIGAMFANLVEASGLLKYGMFLMLVRSEFVRHEKGKQPFCFASIELELPPGVQLSDVALGKIGERFEKVCLPLDTLTYAGQGRFYALFPQQESIAVSVAVKQFINNIVAIPLDSNLHGSAVKSTAGLSDVPRDGADFQRIFQHANGLRSQATQAKKIVSSSF